MKEGKGVVMNFFPYLNLGFASLNHEIKRVTVVSSLDCAMECTATRECRSFSFNSNESVHKVYAHLLSAKNLMDMCITKPANWLVNIASFYAKKRCLI